MRISTLIAALLLVPVLAMAASTTKSARFAEQFRRADADGNGMLSRAEAAKGAPLLAERFDTIDFNRDGLISPEEMRAYRRAGRLERGAGGSAAGAKFDVYFARADTNGDGALSRAEVEKGLPRVARKFERIDRDGDGRLTREEMQAWLAARRAARVGRGSGV